MSDNKLGIIIQARLGSTRLPGKILKPFGNSTLLLFLIERLKKLNIPIVVATTTSANDDELCNYLKENNIIYYRGSEQDVLQRFIDAAEENTFTDIIRICSDSPFVDISYLKKLIELWDNTIDYLSFSHKNVPTVLCHFGVFAEIVKLSALKQLKDFNDSTYNEHVTYGVYKNPHQFEIKLVELPSTFDNLEEVRLTVDTPQDYENVKYILTNLKGAHKIPFLDICSFVLKDVDLVSKMKKIIKENIKS